MGTPVLETDTKGDIVYIALTDINGNAILRDERNDSTLQNKLYTGHKYDNVTGLTYAHARYLDTRTHTFTTVDPLYYQLSSAQLYNPQLMNSYSYANNNPVSNTDPTGLWSISAAYNSVKSAVSSAVSSAKSAFTSFVSSVKSYVSGGSSNPTPTKTTAPTYLNNISLKSNNNSNLSVPSGGMSASTPSSGSGGGAGLTTLSLAVSMTPILGNVYSGLNAASGMDVLTMRQLTNTERALEGGFALIPGGGVGKVIGKGVEKALGKEIVEESFFKNTRYGSNVLEDINNKMDPFHSFPELVHSFESSAKTFTKLGEDGKQYVHLLISGSYRNKDGAFHFIKDLEGEITHRMFEIN